jgi:hypothetical protein
VPGLGDAVEHDDWGSVGGALSSDRRVRRQLGDFELRRSQQTRAQTQALKFAVCMRKHGLPNFPDPTFSHGNIGQKGFDPNSPQFQSAQKVCTSFNAFSG